LWSESGTRLLAKGSIEASETYAMRVRKLIKGGVAVSVGEREVFTFPVEQKWDWGGLCVLGGKAHFRGVSCK
jgi:hypothetical protein